MSIRELTLFFFSQGNNRNSSKIVCAEHLPHYHYDLTIGFRAGSGGGAGDGAWGGAEPRRGGGGGWVIPNSQVQ